MKNLNSPTQATVRVGSATATEIYLSVGVALSFWESSEDILEKLFETLCQNGERVGFESFCAVSRQSREKMLLSALGHYAGQILSEESDSVIQALKELTKLAPFRNQIAHGFVSKMKTTVGGKVVMDGNFIVSTQDPSGKSQPRGLNVKYAHTAFEIDEWRDKVRVHRGTIMDVWMAITIRRQGKSDG